MQNESYPYGRTHGTRYPFEDTSDVWVDVDPDGEGAPVVLLRTRIGELFGVEELLVIGDLLHITWYEVGSERSTITNIPLTSRVAQAIQENYPYAYQQFTREEALVRWPNIKLT